MSLLAIIVYAQGINNAIVTQYEERSIDIARLAAEGVDSQRLSNVRDAVLDIYTHASNKVESDEWGTPQFNAYVSQFDSIYGMEDYQAVLAQLRKMQDVVDVDCLYNDPNMDNDASDVLKRADEAMYINKRKWKSAR